MSKLIYFSSLRSEILKIITGVENSGWSLFWDEITPNYITKSKLEEVYKKYLSEAEQYGLYVVTRHCDCLNPKHSKYPVSNEYDLEIVYRDSNYIWSGGQMYQGTRNCVCPCSPQNKRTLHHVIDDVIYKKKSDHGLCSKLENILFDVSEAIESAGDKKPRSAIRENLLRAVLRINDQLLPESMDSYIQSSLEKQCITNA